MAALLQGFMALQPMTQLAYAGALLSIDSLLSIPRPASPVLNVTVDTPVVNVSPDEMHPPEPAVSPSHPSLKAHLISTIQVFIYRGTGDYGLAENVRRTRISYSESPQAPSSPSVPVGNEDPGDEAPGLPLYRTYALEIHPHVNYPDCFGDLGLRYAQPKALHLDLYSWYASEVRPDTTYIDHLEDMGLRNARAPPRISQAWDGMKMRVKSLWALMSAVIPFVFSPEALKIAVLCTVCFILAYNVHRRLKKLEAQDLAFMSRSHSLDAFVKALDARMEDIEMKLAAMEHDDLYEQLKVLSTRIDDHLSELDTASEVKNLAQRVDEVAKRVTASDDFLAKLKADREIAAKTIDNGHSTHFQVANYEFGRFAKGRDDLEAKIAASLCEHAVTLRATRENVNTLNNRTHSIRPGMPGFPSAPAIQPPPMFNQPQIGYGSPHTPASRLAIEYPQNPSPQVYPSPSPAYGGNGYGTNGYGQQP